MGKIMIIDDSPIDRKLIRQILKANLKTRITFSEAEDGCNKIKKMKAEDIEVCILDIMMPYKDGFQVLKELKEDIILKDIPVIVCTALNDEKAIKKALDNGAHDYFKKPLSEEDMRVSLPLKVRNAMELTSRKKEILYLSYHDKLTGLYNRRYFEEEMEKLITQESLPISLIVGDVNGLKLANDAFGHDFGDRLLVRIASILKEESNEDTIIARTGGDEFVIVMPRTDLIKARGLIQRIRERCQRESEDPICPSISLGCAVMEQLGLNLPDLFKTAEDRMYQSKILDGQSHRSSIISALKNIMSIHYPEAEKQNQRMEKMAIKFSSTFHLSEEQLNNLMLLIYLRNIGISALPEEILSKKNELSPEEANIVEKHCEIGFRILSSIAELSHISKDILYHHELWNGQGYPYGLKEDQIPLNTRIFTLLKTCDQFIEGIKLKEPGGKEDLVSYLTEQSGKKLDPKLVESFIQGYINT
jgi:diguanylate cyclase (GGDEF)-like protein